MGPHNRAAQGDVSTRYGLKNETSDRIKKQESRSPHKHIKTHERLLIFLLKKPLLSCTDEQQLLDQRVSGNICGDVHAISDQILQTDVLTASDRFFL